MSGTRAEIAQAEAQAALAKAQMQETLGRLKNRISPSVRAREVWDDVRETGATLADDALEFTYDQPKLVAGATGAGLLLLLRRPLMRLARRFSRLFHRKPKWDAEASRTTASRRSAAGSEGDRR